jgi:predicted acyltransferase
MLWIVGGAVLARKLAALTEWPWLQWFAGQMHHPKWIGFTFYDLIFPLFLFLAGVAMPYSLGRRLEAGDPKWKLLRKVAVRVFLLVVLGIVYNGGLAFKPLAETRVCSVLGYIGLAYGFAALIFLYSRPRTQAIWAVGILLGYWAALVWIPVPGYGAGVLTPDGCITSYLDRELLPWRLHTPHYDPQGILVTVPAIATALFGALTGWFLRAVSLTELRKALILLAVGAAALGVAKLWGLVLPISKDMWNGTFVFHCAGWSLLLLGLFYLIIDALGFWRWSFFFIVIGMNPITIYLGTRIVNVGHTSNFLFGGMVSKSDDPLRGVLGALAYILTWWLVLLFLYRKKLFLRV